MVLSDAAAVVCLYIELCSTHRLTISTSRSRLTGHTHVSLFSLKKIQTKQKNLMKQLLRPRGFSLQSYFCVWLCLLPLWRFFGSGLLVSCLLPRRSLLDQSAGGPGFLKKTSAVVLVRLYLCLQVCSMYFLCVCVDCITVLLLVRLIC